MVHRACVRLCQGSWSKQCRRLTPDLLSAAKEKKTGEDSGKAALLSQSDGVGRLIGEASGPGPFCFGVSLVLLPGSCGEERRQQRPGDMAQDVTRNFVHGTAEVK